MLYKLRVSSISSCENIELPVRNVVGTSTVQVDTAHAFMHSPKQEDTFILSNMQVQQLWASATVTKGQALES